MLLSQFCIFQFSNCTSKAVFQISPLNLELLSLNGQWTVMNSSAIRDQVAPTTKNGSKYDRVTFNFKLARMNMFHMLNIVVPLILVSRLCFNINVRISRYHLLHLYSSRNFSRVFPQNTFLQILKVPNNYNQHGLSQWAQNIASASATG